MKRLLPLLLLLASCGERDPRDIPYAEFSTHDSAMGMRAIESMTDEEKELMTAGFLSYARDTNELKRKTINQLIERGREIQGAGTTR